MKLPTTLRKPINWGWSIVNYGVTSELSFDEKKKTRLLNLLALTASIALVSFAILNLVQQRYVGVMLNLAILVGTVSIIRTHKNRKYRIGRLLVSTIGVGIFSFAALFYRNGSEYFLIINIVATVVLFTEKKYVLLVSFVNAICFLAIKILHFRFPPEEIIPELRIIINIVWMLLLIMMALYYYKAESQLYEEKIEKANTELQRNQQQLMTQKLVLQKKSDQLEALNHTKEKLISVIAHDMRAPLGGVKTSLELLQKNVINSDEFKEFSIQLSSQIDTLYDTLENLLHWSYNQLKGFHAEPKAVMLRSVVQNIVLLLHEAAKQKQLKVSLQISEGTMVYVDPEHLKVIIRNILSNAIKFSFHNSSIELGAGKLNDNIEIYVQDSGIGMSDAVIGQLFKTDVLQAQRGTHNEKGTGVGLALCREFIEINHGSVRVESEEKKGSRFIITLPAAS